MSTPSILVQEKIHTAAKIEMIYYRQLEIRGTMRCPGTATTYRKRWSIYPVRINRQLSQTSAPHRLP